MDIPLDLISGAAVGGAIVGGVTLRTFEKVCAKGDKEPPATERLLAELLAATRHNGETLRHLRDITASMQGDHRVLETKIDQVTKEANK